MEKTRVQLNLVPQAVKHIDQLFIVKQVIILMLQSITNLSYGN